MRRRHGRAHTSSTRRTSSVQHVSSEMKHTPSNKKVNYTRPPKGAKGAAATPRVSSVTHTPEDKTSNVSTMRESTSTYRSHYRPSLPSPSGSAQGVLVLGLVIFLFASWKDVGSPMVQSIWNKQPNNIQWGPWLGMLVMLLIMFGLASISDDMAGLMIIFEVGFALVLVIMNPTNVITNFFGLFTSTGGSKQSNPAQQLTPTAQQPPKFS